MKSNIIPFTTAQNVAPASDGLVIAQALNFAIAEFGAENLAMTLVDSNLVASKMAA